MNAAVDLDDQRLQVDGLALVLDQARYGLPRRWPSLFRSMPPDSSSLSRDLISSRLNASSDSFLPVGLTLAADKQPSAEQQFALVVHDHLTIGGLLDRRDRLTSRADISRGKICRRASASSDETPSLSAMVPPECRHSSSRTAPVGQDDHRRAADLICLEPGGKPFGVRQRVDDDGLEKSAEKRLDRRFCLGRTFSRSAKTPCSFDADILFLGKELLHLRRVNGPFFLELEQRREPVFLGRMLVVAAPASSASAVRSSLRQSVVAARSCSFSVFRSASFCFLGLEGLGKFLGVLLVSGKGLSRTLAFFFEPGEAGGQPLEIVLRAAGRSRQTARTHRCAASARREAFRSTPRSRASDSASCR